MRKIKRYAMIGVATVGGGALLGNVFISVEKKHQFFSFFSFFQHTHTYSWVFNVVKYENE